LREEEARWKIYSKALELGKMNKPLEELALMKTMDGEMTEQIRWVFLFVKGFKISKQWKGIEP
jgi:hypothetical protein